MTKLRERLDIIARTEQEDLEFYLQQLNQNQNITGWTQSSISSRYHLLAVAAYCFQHDIQSFRDQLSESARYRKMLFEKREQGEPIDDSYVSMHSFQHVLNALAAANFNLAKSFVKLMGGRNEIELAHDHPFDRALGYCLKAVILDDEYTYAKWLSKMYEASTEKQVVRLAGYADALKAIHDRDKDAFDQAIQKIVTDHKVLCRKGGLFDNNPDEIICLWGLGLVNLARFKGLDVHFNHEYIPGDLIVEQLGQDELQSTHVVH